MPDEDAAAHQRGEGTGADLHRPAETEFAPADLRPLSPPEESIQMLEAHAPHKAIQTWADFFIHIATIVVGLLIAVGLEQTVEALHHRQQRAELETQMRVTVEGDTHLVAGNLDKLETYRTYLVDVRNAIVGQRRGTNASPTPAPDDPRALLGTTGTYMPSIAPYEAARENGTVSTLSSERISLFNRLALQHSSLTADRSNWERALVAGSSIRARFSDSRAKYSATIVPDNDLSMLSDPELTEYQTVVSNLIEATDVLLVRLRRFDAECLAFLGGAATEKALIDASQSVDKDAFSWKPMTQSH